MTLDDLRHRLDKDGFRPDAFSLDGESRDETHVMCQSNGSWFVYYAERGHRREERRFDNEEAAVACLLERLEKDPTTKVRYS